MRRAAPLALLIAWRAGAQGVPPGQEDLGSTPVQEAVVEGARRKEPAAETLRGREARELAGTHGDALLAAQMLPAVGRAPLGSGQLVVWGAAPRETRLLLDGIELPALYHGGGLRSVLPTELVKRIELMPAAFGPQYGRALGGVLAIEAAPPELAPTRLLASLDPLDVHASAEVPLGGGHLFAGARYSLLDRLLGPLLSTRAREVFPLPRYWDAQLVAAFPLREGERLDLLLLGAADSALRDIDAADKSVARGDATTLRWGRLGARYRRDLEGGADATAVIWIGDDFESLRTLAGPAFAEQARWSQSGGLRAGWHLPLAEGAALTLGTDALLTRTRLRRSGSLTTPAREGDVVAFGQAPGTEVAFDDWTVLQTDLAVFASGEISLGRFTLAPGLRLAAAATEASRLSPRVAQTTGIGLSQLEWFAEPRLSLSARATDRVRLFAAAGLHHQAPAPEDLSAVFGAPALASSSALHASLGASWLPASFLELESTGFFRSLDGLVVRSPLPTPLPAHSLVQQGIGKSYGLQLVARSKLIGPLSGFFSALVSRSERQDLAEGPTRAFDFDQPLVLTAAASYRYESYTLGARLRIAAGLPRTPVVGSYLDSRLGRADPIFGLHNSERLPAFAQLDLRADRRFELGRGRELRISLEVQNAAARSNAEDFVYSSDWSSRGALSGLPPVALLGLELTL